MWRQPKRANLRGASLVAANLYGAFLYDAVLEGANFEDANKALATIDVPFPSVPGLLSPQEEDAATDGSDMRDPPEFTMPDGLPFSRYLEEVVPALLTAGGKTVREVVEFSVWAYDSRPYPDSPRWAATPLGVAFGVSVLREVPPGVLAPRLGVRASPLPSPDPQAQGRSGSEPERCRALRVQFRLRPVLPYFRTQFPDAKIKTW